MIYELLVLLQRGENWQIKLNSILFIWLQAKNWAQYLD